MEPYDLSEQYYAGGSYDRPLEGVDSCFNQDKPEALHVETPKVESIIHFTENRVSVNLEDNEDQ